MKSSPLCKKPKNNPINIRGQRTIGALYYFLIEILVIEYLINFDRQTLCRGITQAVNHFDSEAIGAAGSWLTTENTRSTYRQP